MTEVVMGISLKDAEQCLRMYASSANAYAWPFYDEDPSPAVLTGADLTAPALLSYPIRGRILEQMGCDDRTAGNDSLPNPYRALFERMEEFVGVDDGAMFHELSVEAIGGLSNRKPGEDVEGPESWNSFVRCLDAVGDCEQLTSVAVTKILHRKRPELVPLNDSRVRTFFGVSHRYPQVLARVHAEISNPTTFEQLRQLAEPYTTPQGRPMTPLRALDIIAWMSTP